MATSGDDDGVMSTHKTDTRPLLATAADTAGDVIAAITPDQFARPTPCGTFDVRTLIGHMHMVLRRINAIGNGLDPMSVSEDVATDLSDADLIGTWATESTAAQKAWATGSALDTTIVFPWVTVSGAATLIMYAGELTTHTWDLAKATAQTVEWNDAVIFAALGAITAMLPDPDRATAFEAAREQMPAEFRDFPPPFADAVRVGPDAALIDRLVAWTGRQP